MADQTPTTAYQFPVLGSPGEFVSRSLLEEHEATAKANHDGQSLKRLAERGGLDWSELAAVVQDRRWRPLPDKIAKQIVLEAYAKFLDTRDA